MVRIDSAGESVFWLEFGLQGIAAIVMMAKPVGMMQPADRRDTGSMLLQRFRERVVRTCLGDLIAQRVHTVRQIHEDAASRFWSKISGVQRPHAVQQRQSQ
jgi:hypothetical protein